MTAILVIGLLHSTACLAFLFGYRRFFDLSDASLIAAVEAQVAPLSVAIFLGFLSALVGGMALKVFGARWWKAVLALVVTLNASELWVLVIDRQLYLVTRVHFDIRVVRILFQPNALEVIGLPPGSVLQGIVIGIVTLTFSLGLCWLAVRLAHSSFRGRLSTPFRYLGIAALLVFISDRSVYAVVAPGMSELSDPSVVLPFADWLAVELPEETAKAVFGVKALRSRHEDVHRKDKQQQTSDIDYPTPEAVLWQARSQKYPNILVLVLESFRADAVEPAAMPNLSALAQRSWSAHAHFSLSNCTQLGLFSLIYGLSPTLWMPATERSLPPFTYELLRRSGYELSVTSSASPRWFGMDRLVMRPDLALGNYGADPDPDGKAVEALAHFMEKERSSPFFALLFLNGPHFPYYVPPGDELFKPAARSIDVSDPNLRTHRDEIINRYRNALHRVDTLLGQIFEVLERQGLEQETIIAITGDHGESFWEDGRFSHTSLLSQAQLQVPLIIYIPGKSPRQIEKLTSHVDVMPTLLDAAGIDLDPVSYADGHSLMREEGGRPALAAQFSPDELRDFALLDWPLLVRFVYRGGKIALTGAENLDPAQRGENPLLHAKAEKWPSLLSALQHASRWWPETQ
jgi:membrane-anchored protein YejM (alkaline phosphatase superfamily)